MAYLPFEKLRIYQLAERLTDEIWKIVIGWDNFARDTLGKQLVRAADSIGANLAEGCGRGSYLDNRRFVLFARGSLNETKHWLRRAFRRGLLPADQVSVLKPMLDELAPSLNAYLRSIVAAEVRKKSRRKTPNNKLPITNYQLPITNDK